MKQISLSIEELIYCFYSEGFFEQGNALKQVYFGELDDEKMDLLLQVTCRSLLARNLLDYKNHKFSLVEDLASFIAVLNYSEQSIKASRHSVDGAEESLSFHFRDDKIIKQSLHYDEQVHRFTSITLQEASQMVAEFYRVETGQENTEIAVSITQGEFEELLARLHDNNKQFDAPTLQGDLKQFDQILKETNGLLNTLLFLEFNEEKEPLAKNVVMFTNKAEGNWLIEKRGHFFELKRCNMGMLERLLKENLSISTQNNEKETVIHGK